MMTATPIPKNANIETGTHLGLDRCTLGEGGVYRDDGDSVTRPDFVVFARLRCFLTSATSTRIGAFGNA